jgi:hypothetical protein
LPPIIAWRGLFHITEERLNHERIKGKLPRLSPHEYSAAMFRELHWQCRYFIQNGLGPRIRIRTVGEALLFYSVATVDPDTFIREMNATYPKECWIDRLDPYLIEEGRV